MVEYGVYAKSSLRKPSSSKKSSTRSANDLLSSLGGFQEDSLFLPSPLPGILS